MKILSKNVDSSLIYKKTQETKILAETVVLWKNSVDNVDNSVYNSFFP